ncbi:MAG: DUF2330 domain-containing protein [Acidimicrobiia bacterium]
MRTPRHRRLLARAAAVAAASVVVAGTLAGPAAACGGVVGENGTIQLQRTTTLAAWSDGVEHYVTSFEFTGEGEEVGSIIPLPAVPTLVERGGDWTLQRLRREVAPPPEFRGEVLSAAGSSADTAEVLLETKIDALDITILRGGGTEVGTWALEHGFFLSPDAPEVLDAYSARSQIFMAARFDAGAAKARGQQAGDGTPIHLAMPLAQPWVPLRILSLGQDAGSRIVADVFLLTDERPKLLAGGNGLTLERSEPASRLLLDDLRSDTGTSWVPAKAWFTYLSLDTDAGSLDYDLATSLRDEVEPSLVDAGIEAPTVATEETVAQTVPPTTPDTEPDDTTTETTAPRFGLVVNDGVAISTFGPLGATADDSSSSVLVWAALSAAGVAAVAVLALGRRRSAGASR